MNVELEPWVRHKRSQSARTGIVTTVGMIAVDVEQTGVHGAPSGSTTHTQLTHHSSMGLICYKNILYEQCFSKYGCYSMSIHTRIYL